MTKKSNWSPKSLWPRCKHCGLHARGPECQSKESCDKQPISFTLKSKELEDEPLQPAKSLQEIKSPESFLDDAIWRRWGQRLFDLANGMSGESFIALAKPQVIEAMELYASQFRTTPVQEEEIKAKLKAEYQRGYNAAQFNYSVGPYSDNN